MTKNQKSLFLIVLLLAVAGALYYTLEHAWSGTQLVSVTPPPTPGQGTSVLTLSFGQKAELGDTVFTISNVTEDSRCATGVQCVWTGRVAVAIDAIAGMTPVTGTLATDKPLTIGGWTLTLADVEPPKTTTAIPPTDYRFTISAVQNDAAGGGGQQTTGIHATALLGPTCPVMRNPPDPQCADKPYQGAFAIKDSSGRTVRTVSTNAQGTFETSLPAGRYTIVQQSTRMLPRCAPQDVVVATGTTTEASISCDTGIR